MNNTVNFSKLNSTELKAVAFDLTNKMNMYQNNLNIILKEIEKKVRLENLPKPKPKPDLPPEKGKKKSVKKKAVKPITKKAAKKAAKKKKVKKNGKAATTVKR